MYTRHLRRVYKTKWSTLSQKTRRKRCIYSGRFRGCRTSSSCINILTNDLVNECRTNYWHNNSCTTTNSRYCVGKFFVSEGSGAFQFSSNNAQCGNTSQYYNTLCADKKTTSYICKLWACKKFTQRRFVKLRLKRNSRCIRSYWTQQFFKASRQLSSVFS